MGKRKNIKPLECEVVRLLPSSAAHDRRAVPQDLIGARIIEFGSLPYEEEGGLVIVYQRDNEPCQRVVLAFNELAMWVLAKGAS